MSRGGDVGDEPVPEPAELVGGKEEFAIEGDGWGACRTRGIPLDGGAPVD